MAGNSNTAKKVKQLVEPIVNQLNIELVDTEFVKEGSKWFLRLYIDKPGGVSIDDCQLVHENVIDVIDEEDPISGPYIFEVSSPGLDRPLKTERDFTRNIGEILELSLYAPDVAGKKAYEGILEAWEDGKITVKDENSETRWTFNLKDVALAKKAIRFD
ncbi:MAG: ribosome maturation factor RimP [Ruminococcaceae bacterium]|nr:ribosome maturation factor RimP [Oscillospiraceae bacterium]